MGRSKLYLQVITIILCLFAMVLPGCGTAKISIPQNYASLSLTDTWDQITKAMNVQGDSLQLTSFRLVTDKIGNILGLTFIVHNNASTPAGVKTYQMEINAKGQLTKHTYQNKMPDTLHPKDVFSEIDKVHPSSLILGEGGLSLQADFQLNSNVGYSADHQNIFQVDDGILRPLKAIQFSSTTFCVISVYQLIDNQRTITAAPTEKPTTQLWFLSRDVAHAKNVEYLESQ